MSIIFNPTERRCFVPCTDSLNGRWCPCQQPIEAVIVDSTPTFEEVVEKFKQQMIKENHDNAHKGDILSWNNVEEMLVELEYHKAKLYIALKRNNPDLVKEYLADCSNILLAIGNAWKLYE